MVQLSRLLGKSFFLLSYHSMNWMIPTMRNVKTPNQMNTANPQIATLFARSIVFSLYRGIFGALTGQMLGMREASAGFGVFREPQAPCGAISGAAMAECRPACREGTVRPGEGLQGSVAGGPDGGKCLARGRRCG